MHGTGQKLIRVLIIDDSAFTRQTIKRMLEKSPAVEVVGVAVDGYDGMKKVMKLKPDVITLDLEMPRVDGFTLLRWLMEENPPMPVIIVSSHGEKSTVFKALELGAVDFIVKPTKNASKELEAIEGDLLRKVLSITSLNMDKLKRNISWVGYKDAVMPQSYGRFEDKDIKIVTIGASTGGPAALQVVLSMLPGNFPAPILISQHMPYGFTRQFASRMNKVSALTVKEAEHGETIEAGKALICPGGHHVMLNNTRGETVVTIKDSTEDDIYIPSIDLMMMSAAEVFGPKIIGIVLTGMGSDGKAGMKEIKRRGGFTIAESEESAVIFGMPNEVISAGAADMIAPLQQIPAEILKRFKGPE